MSLAQQLSWQNLDLQYRASVAYQFARYAVALTPDVVELIDPAEPNDPIGCQFIPDPAELEEEIRITVLHELAHYFGLDEDRLEELGYS